MHYRKMEITDYPELIVLFSDTPGITVKDADSFESTKKYLDRNPGLSYVAVKDDIIIGCSMAGHDGRRGYLQHVLVKEEFRNRGIATKLVDLCLDSLAELGIYKTHLFVMSDNRIGNDFWRRKGWVFRDDINTFSYNNSGNENI